MFSAGVDTPAEPPRRPNKAVPMAKPVMTAKNMLTLKLCSRPDQVRGKGESVAVVVVVCACALAMCVLRPLCFPQASSTAATGTRKGAVAWHHTCMTT